MPSTSNAQVLSYRAPGEDLKESPLDPAWATALALPGVCGFCLLGGALLFESRLAWKIGPHAGIVLWVVALGCAIYSFVYFRERRKSRWVKFCLALNLLGLVFTFTPPGWVVLMLAVVAPR